MPDLLLERVELPQGRRLRGGLLANAETLPSGWENGIAFRTVACAPPVILAPCEVADGTPSRPSVAEFLPVYVRQGAACSTIPQVGLVNMALNRLEGTIEWAAGYALATGALSQNPSFADADPVADFSGLEDPALAAAAAVSCLEQAVADLGFGADAVLHAPFKANAWLSAMNLNVDGYSPSGLRWITSPGYPTVNDGTVSIWATGPVWAGVSSEEVIVDPQTGKPLTDHLTNLQESWAQRLVLSAFDPCLNLSATFAVQTCNGDS